MKSRWLDITREEENRKELNAKFNLYFPDREGKQMELFDYQFFFIKELLSGYDTLTILPTGAGKSICFQLPGILIPGVTIVISPLISLITEQVKTLNERYDIKAACFFGTGTDGYDYLTAAEKKKLVEEDRKKGWLRRNIGYREIATGRYKFVYVTPERFTSPHFMELLRHIEVNFIALDEAHCVSMWGHDFRPDYAGIKSVLRTFEKRPVIGAFTATASPAVQRDVAGLLELNLQKKDGKTWIEDPHFFDIKDPEFFVKKNHDYKVYGIKAGKEYYIALSDEDKSRYEWEQKEKALKDILEKHKGECGIIFCSTYDSIETVYEGLSSMEQYADRVCRYTGKDKRNEKTASARKFKEGSDIIMVATNAFGMGIDKKDIRFVIHYNLSSDIENYYQETGRGGRDGNKADCYVLYNEIFEEKNPHFFTDKGMIKGSLYFNERIRGKAMKSLVKDEASIKRNMNEYLKGNNPFDDTDESDRKGIAALECIENRTLERKLSFPRALFANRCLIAERIRKGLYDGEVETGKKEVGKAPDKRKKIAYELFYDGIPYADVEEKDRITYFDMMVADAVYTLELFKRKITLKNIMVLLSGDENITLTKRKRDFVQNCLERLIHTGISLKLPDYFSQGLWYEDDRKDFGYCEFLPLVKEKEGVFRPKNKEIMVHVPMATGQKKKKFDIRDRKREVYVIPPIYDFAEKLFQFYSFSSYELNLRGRNEFLYSEREQYLKNMADISWKMFGSKEEKTRGCRKYKEEIGLYENAAEHSVENMILIHFLLRRISCSPTAKRVNRYRDAGADGQFSADGRISRGTGNVLSGNIRISVSESEEENIYDYLYRGINFDSSESGKKSRRGNFSCMNQYSRKRKIDTVFEYGGNGYTILKRMEKNGIIDSFKYEDSRINLMPKSKRFLEKQLLLTVQTTGGEFYKDVSLDRLVPMPLKNKTEEERKSIKECFSKKWDYILKAGNKLTIFETYNFTMGKNSSGLKEVVRKLEKYAEILKKENLELILGIKPLDKSCYRQIESARREASYEIRILEIGLVLV